MRRLLAGLVVLAGLLTSAPTAGAETVRNGSAAGAADPLLHCLYPYPGPAGWIRVGGSIRSCQRCVDAGNAGVSRGEWPEFRCTFFPVGLDVVYYLFVPPQS